MSDLEQKIEDNASGPKKFTSDSISVEQHSLKAQIEADNHLAGKKAARKGMKGLIRQQAVPPGAV